MVTYLHVLDARFHFENMRKGYSGQFRITKETHIEDRPVVTKYSTTLSDFAVFV